MSARYRTDYIPRWVWALLVISLLLVLLIVLSMARTKTTGETVVIGHEVQTGNPADYVKQPPPPATTSPGAATTPTPSTPGVGANGSATQPNEAPTGMPQDFTYRGQTWDFAGGPVQVDVMTTGELTGDFIIYHKSGEEQPYTALYLESTPNSGQFYKYTAETTPTAQ